MTGCGIMSSVWDMIHQCGSMIYQNKAIRITINLLKLATDETSLVVLFLHNIWKLNAKEMFKQIYAYISNNIYSKLNFNTQMFEKCLFM